MPIQFWLFNEFINQYFTTYFDIEFSIISFFSVQISQFCDMESTQKFHCGHCDKDFAFKHGLKRHLKAHENNLEKKCDLCSKTYKNYEIHFKAYHDSATCPICGKLFELKKRLYDHIRTVHRLNGEFECELCLKKFKGTSMLNVHKKTVHGPKDKECDSCDMKFTNSGDLKKHNDRVHLKIVKFNCDICNKFLSSKALLRFHTKSVHEKKKDYECDICKKCFTQPGHLQAHRRRIHNDKVFRCDICAKKFKNEGSFNSHQNDHMGKKEKSQVGSCEKAFSTNKDLQKQKKEKENNYECDLCEKYFTRSDHLESHRRSVHTDHCSKCDICSKTFKNERAFKNHQIGHLGKNEQLECDKCGKSFSSKQSLQKHLDNTCPKKDKKPEIKVEIKCLACEKLFPKKSYMRRHFEAIHGNPKSNCNICGKAIRDNRHLKSHMTSVHGYESDHYCKDCNKYFSTPFGLCTNMDSTYFYDPSSRSLNNNIRHATFVMSTHYSF